MTSAFSRRGASSSPDAELRRAARRAVLSPYAGAKDSRRLRIARWLILPLLALFCLAYGTAFAIVAPFMMAFFPIPIAILGMIAIWALPDTDRAPTNVLSVLLFAFTLALILWPNYLAIALPGLPWITMIRLFGFPLAVALLICLSVSEPFRAELSQTLRAFPQLWKLIVAFSVVEFLTIACSKDPASSLQRVVVQEVDWTALFFVACSVFLKPRKADAWAILFSATTVPIALIALREYQMGQLPWADHIPSFLQVQDESVNRILAGAHREEGEYRVQSTFSTPLGLAEYIALALPFLIHYMISDRFAIWIRVAIAGLIYLLINIVLMTDARLGLIGCFLSGLLSLLFWAIQRWRRSQPSVFGPAITLSYPIIAALAYASTLFVGRIREKVWGSGQYDDSTEARKQMYNQGIPMILGHPQGYGSGMGADQLGFRNAAGVLTIDTYYLAIGLDYGVLGFLIYYCAFLLAAGKSTQAALTFETSDRDIALLAPIAISLVNYIVIKSVFSNEENHPLVFIMAGMAVALMSRIQRQAKPAERPAGALPVAEAGLTN